MNSSLVSKPPTLVGLVKAKLVERTRQIHTIRFWQKQSGDSCALWFYQSQTLNPSSQYLQVCKSWSLVPFNFLCSSWAWPIIWVRQVPTFLSVVAWYRVPQKIPVQAALQVLFVLALAMTTFWNHWIVMAGIVRFRQQMTMWWKTEWISKGSSPLVGPIWPAPMGVKVPQPACWRLDATIRQVPRLKTTMMYRKSISHAETTYFELAMTVLTVQKDKKLACAQTMLKVRYQGRCGGTIWSRLCRPRIWGNKKNMGTGRVE